MRRINHRSLYDFWTSFWPWPELPVSYRGGLTGADLADADINTLIGGVIADRAVCDPDPRTRAQRESDVTIASLLGIPFGWDCGRDDCAATPIDLTTTPTPASSVVIHVVTDEATLDGPASNPRVLDGHGIIGGDRTVGFLPAADRVGHLHPDS